METKRTPAIVASTDAGYLALSFSNGKVLNLQPNALNADIIAHAVLHGLKQKLVDAAAISRNPETGRSATIEDKYNAVLEVYERLLAGSWNKTREGGAGSSGGLLFRALCRLYPAKTPEALKEYLEGKTDADKAALRKNPRVAAIIDTLRAEEGKAGGIDTDELLEELED